ncbi:MAG: hypothetical protein EXR28_01620 [Betaproteobacteria bacterium]|nr:hypothetical protein [Betaproteobacteria bacterium]
MRLDHCCTSTLKLRWIDALLRGFYGAVIFFKRSPAAVKIAAAVLLTTSVVALAVALTWYRQLIHPAAGSYNLLALLILLIAPVAVIWLTLCAAIKAGIGTVLKPVFWGSLVLGIVYFMERFA